MNCPGAGRDRVYVAGRPAGSSQPRRAGADRRIRGDLGLKPARRHAAEAERDQLKAAYEDRLRVAGPEFVVYGKRS